MHENSQIAIFCLVNSSLADSQSLHLTDCIPVLTQGDPLLGPVHHLQSVISEVSINVRVNGGSPEASPDALKVIVFPIWLLDAHETMYM